MTSLPSPELGARPFDEVHAGQGAFRTLLEALARPGTIHRLSDRLPDVPAGLNPHVALVAFTLLDQEVCFATAGVAAEQLGAYLALRTGARRGVPHEAGFLFADGREPISSLGLLPVGSLEYPEGGATAVLTVTRLSEDPDGEGVAAVNLSGPGIASSRRLYIQGFASANVETFVELNGEYPLGVDVFLVDLDGRVVGLPRTARVIKESV